MQHPSSTPGAVAIALTFALALAAGAAACAGPPPSCDVPYLDERFGGLTFFLAAADGDGHFEHVFTTGGPITSLTGDWDRTTGELSMTELFAEGLPGLERDSLGTVEVEPDGDSSASLAVVVSFADGASERWVESASRRGCTVEWTRVDDGDARIGVVTAALAPSTWSGGSFAVTRGVATNVSAGEVETATTTTRTDGTVTTTTGTSRRDWTSDAHIERDDPSAVASPDYAEDRIIAADGSATGSYAWWQPGDVFEAGTIEVARTGEVVRTWTRREGDAAGTLLATGTTESRLDGSGTEMYTTSGATPVTCSRSWGPGGAGCTFACDDGTGGACE